MLKIKLAEQFGFSSYVYNLSSSFETIRGPHQAGCVFPPDTTVFPVPETSPEAGS